MALKDFFKKKEEPALDPLKDLTLSRLKVGYILDYDLKTWEVTAYNRYDFGGGCEAHEWEIRSGGESLFLELSVDDEEEYSISKQISVRAIDGDIKGQINKNSKGPETITFENKKYFLDESGTGNFYKNGKGNGEKYKYWDYIDEEDENFVSIEQWDEDEFEASAGYYAEEYQFTNILPR